MKRYAWLAAGGLLAAACGEAPTTGGTANAAAGNDTAPAGSNAALAGEPPAGAGPAGTIPETFRGSWDRDAAACASRSELRLVVEGDRLRFHESVGRLTDVELESPRDVFVTAEFEGEGERWSRDLMLSLEGDGMLTVTELEAPPVTRVRCD